jgi:hypothetical protein
MVFSTHFLKSFLRLESLVQGGLKRGRALCVSIISALFFSCLSVAHADTPVALQELKVVRQDSALYLSADWQFELPSALEDALTKGITLYFVTEVDVRQERWYFYNQRVAHAERPFVLSTLDAPLASQCVAAAVQRKWLGYELGTKLRHCGGGVGCRASHHAMAHR